MFRFAIVSALAHTTKALALSEETGNCCWGGSSCDTAQNCHVDLHCGANKEQCTGECAGMWCPAAPEPATTVAPEPATTAAPEPATTTAPATSEAPEPATTVAPEPANTTAAPEPVTTASPEPATTAAPAPAPDGICCWGGSSCAVAQDCHANTYCNANEDQCTGECAGMWCAEAPPTPVPSNVTTPGPQPCDCGWAAIGCEFMVDDGSVCFNYCCGSNSSAVVAPEPANTTAAPEPVTTASPEPATTAAPAPIPDGICCWGGSSCAVAQDCHANTYCNANEDQCTGECAGMWCAEAPPTPLPSNVTTPGPQPCDCGWAAIGCEFMVDDGSVCFDYCCGPNSGAVVV